MKKYLLAHQRNNAQSEPVEQHYQVWLNTTQTLPDGAPNPAWVRNYHFGPAPQNWVGASLDGTAYTDWVSYCQAEVELLAEAEEAQMNEPAPTVLTIQGTTF